MGYLYGDATESSLDSNYLEFLKAAVDFGVGVLEGSEQIAALQIEAQKRKRGATVEREQLQKVAGDLETTVQNCLAKAEAPLTNKCVHTVRGLVRGEIERSKGAIESGLESELARIESEIRRLRMSNHHRLEKLLSEHDLPQSRQWIDYKLSADGAASAQLVGVAASQLTWAMDLEVPGDHQLHDPLRVDRLFPQLTVDIPEMSGWVRKRIKLKTYKLTKDYVVGLNHREGRAVLELRSHVQERDNGFDITFSGGMPRQIVRIHKGTASDPSEPQQEDMAGLQELYRTLTKSLNEVRMNRRELKSARLDDMPLERHKEPSLLVDRLVKQMAPVVAEISAHSLSPTELVLKRVLADDQRVEIFASKTDLNSKVESLGPKWRDVFAPLELDKPNPIPGSQIPPPVRSSPPGPVAATAPPLPAEAKPEAPAIEDEISIGPEISVEALPGPGDMEPAPASNPIPPSPPSSAGPSKPGPSGPGEAEPSSPLPLSASPPEVTELPGLFDEDSGDGKPRSLLSEIPARNLRHTNPGMGPSPSTPPEGEAEPDEIQDESTTVMEQEVADIVAAQLEGLPDDEDEELPKTVQRQVPPLPKRPPRPSGRPGPPAPPRRPPPMPPARPPVDSATSVEIDIDGLGD